MSALKRLLRGPGRFRSGRASSVEVSEARGVRHLHLGGEAIQSAMRLSDPSALELAYTRAMMGGLLFHPEPKDMLMIGLGGGSIARFVHERMKTTHMTVVEINAQVVAAARAMFGLPDDDERLNVEVADGGEYVPGRRRCFDLLLLDAFEDGVSVKALATEAFYRACADALRPGGVFVVNFIEDEPKFATYLQRIEAAFDGRVVMLPAEDRVNNIILAINGGPRRASIEVLKRRARTLKQRLGLPYDRFLNDLIAHNVSTNAFLHLGV